MFAEEVAVEARVLLVLVVDVLLLLSSLSVKLLKLKLR